MTESAKLMFDGSTDALTILEGMDLKGTTMLITGANTGIGFETARSLALHNARVVLACRNIKMANEKKQQICVEKVDADVHVLELDLASLKSVRKCAHQFLAQKWPLHVLILNAATFADTYETTEDGLEKTFQVNHLGHFYLTRLLCPSLESSAPSRVVVVSSHAHARAAAFQPKLLGPAGDLQLKDLSPSCATGYWYMHAYNLSKFCNNCFAFALNRRLQSKGVVVNALHPGRLISTDLPRRSCLMRLLFTLAKPFTKSLQQGAATTVLCAASAEYANLGGLYLDNCAPASCHKQTRDVDIQERIWTICDQIITQFETK